MVPKKPGSKGSDPAKVDPLFLTLFESKPSKGDLKRSEIVQTAIELIATTGIENTSYESIAKAMGTRRSHIAYYFKSKEEIVFHAIQYVFKKGYQIVVEYLERAKTPKQRIDAYVDGQFDWLATHREFVAVMTLFMYYTRLNDKYRRMQIEVRKGGYARLEGLVESLPKKKRSANTIHLLHSVITSEIYYLVTTETLDPESVAKAKKRTRELFAEVLD